MTLKNLDLSIIGNGSIAYFCAYYISKSLPSLQIGLFSESPRFSSASAAAGAMHAVFGEIEGDISTSLYEQKCLKIGLDSRVEWNNFFKENNLENIRTGENTYIYLQKNATEYERKNFIFASSAAKESSCMRLLDNKEISSYFSLASEIPEEVCELKGEFCFSAPLFLKSMEQILMEMPNIQFFNTCKEVRELNKNEYQLSIPNGDTVYSRKVICASGYKSQSILPDIEFQELGQSIGLALEISNVNCPILTENAVRTVSRGGAQCGIHLVPRSNSIYLGAGSYIAKSNFYPTGRTDEVKYLIDQAQKDILGKRNIYESFISPLIVGSRPRSLDSYPLIGSFSNHPSIFLATGTNRIGLTWSPTIAKYALSWLDENFNDKSLDYQLIFDDWRPDRDLIAFGSNEECLEYYVNTRVTNEFEHGLINSASSNDAKKRIRSYGRKLLNHVNKTLNLNEGYSIHPDSWSVI